MKKQKYHLTKRFLSLFVALVMFITMFDVPIFSAEDDTVEYTNTLDEWSVQAVWNNNSSESFEYNAKKDENINFTLTFSYFLNGASRDYNANEIKFTVKGIGDIQRSGILTAVTTTTQEGSDWDLEYNAEKDEYTFIYKRTISQNQILSGGFQMQWTVNSRKAINGYEYSSSPVFSIVNGSETKSINMPLLSLKYTSVRDYYKIYVEREQLTGLEKEYVDETYTDEDYIWYDYVTTFEKIKKARGIYKSKYFVKITIEDGLSYDDIIALDENNNPIEIVEIEDPETGEMVHGFYKFSKTGEPSTTDTFRLGFKQDVFEDKYIKIDTYLIAVYNDETEEVIIPGNNKRTVLFYDFEYDRYGYSQGKTLTYGYSDTVLVNNLYSGKTISFDLKAKTAREYVSSSSSSATSVYTNAEQHPEKDETFDFIQGDDYISVLLNSGEIRQLEEDEYNFKYVIIPKDSKGYEYEVYAAKSRNILFDEYELVGNGNTSTDKTVHFSDDVKAIYVKIKDVKGTYDSTIKVAVNFKFNWTKEQQKSYAEQIDPDGKLMNFCYLRLVKSDGINFAATDGSNYTGAYGERLKERDYDDYGEYLYRESEEVYLRSAATTIDSNTTLDKFKLDPTGEGGDGNYHSTVTSEGSIIADESGELKKFSLYTVLPKGLLVNDNLEGITVTGTATGVDGKSVDQTTFMNNVSYELRTNSSGEQIVVANFDFTDNPLESYEKTTFSINFPVYVTSATYAVSTAPTYTAYTYTMVHDDGIQKILSTKKASDIYDLDKDGNKTEYTAKSSASQTIGSSIIEWLDAAQKYVKSYTTNAYVHGLETENVSVDSLSELSEDTSKSLYSYRLDLSAGENSIKNIVVFDNIEPINKTVNISGNEITVSSKWHGKLLNVDTSQVDKLGIISTVYYSTNEDQYYELDIDDPSDNGWIEMTKNGSVWTAPEDVEVRSIAVRYDTTNMKDGGVLGTVKNRLLYTTVNMQAPEITIENGYNDDTIAQNNFQVNYDILQAGEDIPNTLHSAVTNVTLNETKPTLTIKKYDITTETPLSGAKFIVYKDEACTDVVEGLEGVEVNNLGIFTGELPSLGTYYMKEIEAPTGYKCSDEIFKIEATNSHTDIEVYNERMTGTVNFTKKDADNETITNLEGAEYQLYTWNGTQVFTDENNVYSTIGTKGTFVTGEKGFTITGLPWGNYYLLETKAPDGYDINEEKVSFSIVRNGDVVDGAITLNLSQSDSEQTANLTLIKTDEMTGNRLKNAWYRLEKKVQGEDGEYEWVDAGFPYIATNAYGELTVEGVKFGEYRFKEVNAPNGYKISETPTESVILDTTTVGKTIELTQSDERKTGSINLTKSSDTGVPIANTKFDLYMVVGEKDGTTGISEDDPADQLIKNNLVTDTNGRITTVEDLEWGEYYFVETYAPTGYKKDDAKFVPETVEITPDNVDITQEVKVTDNQIRGSVKLTKYGENQDPSEEDVLLKDAKFILCDKDGNPVNITANGDGSYSYDKESTVTEMTTNYSGIITVDNLPWGAYYFEETEAPSGYALADKVRFTVNANTCLSMQELECHDSLVQCEITIEKEVDEVLSQYGNPTFIFKIKNSETGQEWTKTIQLNSDKKSGSVTLSVVPGTYTIEEIQVSRYTLENIETIDSDTTGEVTINSDSTTATVTLTADSDSDPQKAKVKFTNTLKNYDKFSHVTGVTNIIAAQKKITGISVEYTGDLIPVDDNDENYTIPKSELIAKIIYEDGSEEDITDIDSLTPTDGDNFTVDNNINNASTEMELTANYAIDGKTYSTKFYVTIAPIVVTPTQKVIYRVDTNNESYFDKDGNHVTANVVYYSDGVAISGGYIETIPLDETKMFNYWVDENGEILLSEEEIIKYLKYHSDITSFTFYAFIDYIPIEPFKYEYTGAYKEFEAPITGYYLLEVWGAAGGIDATPNGNGKGGYSSGYVFLSKGEKLYIAVGGVGSSKIQGKGGGWNGGGNAGTSGTSGGGGGATHIAKALYGDGTLKNYADYKDDVLIVAGGGGGGGNNVNKYGGCGGGESGANGSQYGGTTSSTSGYGIGASQITGNAFGVGADRIGDGGGGGGGWYGGTDGINDSGGGGGSGYISSTLKEAATTSGNTSFPTFADSETTEVGHSGSGNAKITFVGNKIQ